MKPTAQLTGRRQNKDTSLQGLKQSSDSKVHNKPQPCAKQKAREDLYHLRQKHGPGPGGAPACPPTAPQPHVGYREIQYSHGLHKDTEPEEEQAGWVALSPRNRGATCWHKRLTHAETENPDCVNTGLTGASPWGA